MSSRTLQRTGVRAVTFSARCLDSFQCLSYKGLSMPPLKSSLSVRVLYPSRMISADGLLSSEAHGFRLDVKGSIGKGIKEFKLRQGQHPLILGGATSETDPATQFTVTVMPPPSPNTPEKLGSWAEPVPMRILRHAHPYGALITIAVFGNFQTMELPTFSRKGLTAMLLGADTHPALVLEYGSGADKFLHDSARDHLGNYLYRCPGVVLLKQSGPGSHLATRAWTFPLPHFDETLIEIP